jgi:guanylate kinase
MSNEGRRANETAAESGASFKFERGRLIVVCAPSGAGKSSLVELAVERIEHLRFSVSYTTREPRGSEQHGKDYFFVTESEFRAIAERGEFLECAEVHKYLYGTHRAQVEEMLNAGYDVMLDIDVQGANQIQAAMSEAVTVFIMPPSSATLEERLRNRNLNRPDDLETRLRNAYEEVRLWGGFDYLIVNDDLECAYGALQAIIIAERCRPDRQKDRVQAIIATFEGDH